MRVASLASSTEWSLRIKPVYINAFDCLAALAMPADASFEAALASLGVLASHSCDAPLALGLDSGAEVRGLR